ncbi:hypothetical protein CRUP_038049 [Coryphaenoides rupestris]|nr:hypothetical protein CRUP_038049 [Coryphaenoides rupestris]
MAEDDKTGESGGAGREELLRGNLVRGVWNPTDEIVELQSPALPLRGQKDFYPTGSQQQTERLRTSLREHWELVSEERVERLGNLVRGVWNPTDEIVELQSPAGNLQVFHRDLPLSIQDGYEMFLSSGDLSLQKYQRQLNLPPPHGRGANQLKRKRSPSPEATPSVTPSPRPSEKQEDLTNRSSALDQATNHSPPSAQQPIAESPRPPAADVTGRHWWGGAPVPPEQPRQQEVGRSAPDGSASSRWDFLSIRFPDLGALDGPAGPLDPPDPSLLPGATAVGVCDVSPWLGRLNLRRERLCGGERRRREAEERALRNRGPDREVQGCRSWAEYRELMERRSEEQSRRRRSPKGPANLWEEEVTPLHDPREGIPTAELLEKISIVKMAVPAEGEWQISFNVHQPTVNMEFRKSSPGTPYSRMCVCSFEGPVPGLGALQQLSQQSGGDVPVTMAVVDHGDISFYSFKHFRLPLDLPQ